LAGEPLPPAYRWLRTAGWGVARVFSIIALAVAWEVAARSRRFHPYMLPSLSAVLERIWNDLLHGELLLNTGVTLYRALTGFLIGAVAGIVLGMAISRNAMANWFFDPIISVGFPMPKIAFLPVVILWLGVYDLSKITMISVEAIFPSVTATIIGIRGVERELLWSARNMGAGERELLWQIALPAALASDHHRAASRIADRDDRGDRHRDVHGRLRARRAHEHRLPLRRFARRLCRHRGDRSRWLCPGQDHESRTPPSAVMASGSGRAEHRVEVKTRSEQRLTQP
jgi:ABC-type sulfate transport system permease component